MRMRACVHTGERERERGSVKILMFIMLVLTCYMSQGMLIMLVMTCYMSQGNGKFVSCQQQQAKG